MKSSKEQNKRQVIELSTIEGYTPYEGQVLIKPKSKEGLTTPSGVLIGLNVDTQYGEGEESHVADFSATEGDVIALPLHHYTEGYEIPFEVEVGDHVFFSYFGSLHAVDIMVGKEWYQLIDYYYLTAAKRNDQIIILNGFVLLEDVLEEKLSDVIKMNQKVDKTKGIVRYVGLKREYPSGSKYTDEIDIEIGDEVLLRKGCPVVPLERQPYLASFDSGKMYRRIRRRDIVAVLNSMVYD